jgi:hypothetical protein
MQIGFPPLRVWRYIYGLIFKREEEETVRRDRQRQKNAEETISDALIRGNSVFLE